MATPSRPRAAVRAPDAVSVTSTTDTPTPALRKRGPKPGSASRQRIVFAEALMEDCRHRYENTDDTVVDIAADCGVDEKVIRRMADENEWHRHRPAPRQLSPATQLLRDTEALEARRLARGVASEDAAVLESFHASVKIQMADADAERAALCGALRDPADKLKNARVLRDLSAAYKIIRRMRAAPLTTGSAEAHAYVPFDEDDRYANIDAFRNEIARRIEAFVESESRAADAGDDG